MVINNYLTLKLAPSTLFGKLTLLMVTIFHLNLLYRKSDADAVGSIKSE